MGKSKLRYRDADLVLRLYELRREPVMRESRAAMSFKFWPKSFADIEAVLKPENPMNAAYRQTASYWEMVYSFGRHGNIDPDFLIESNGEGLFLFAKIAPYLDEVREHSSPTAFRNAEWMVNKSDEAGRRFEMINARVQKMLSEQK